MEEDYNGPRIRIDRPVLTQQQFDEYFLPETSNGKAEQKSRCQRLGGTIGSKVKSYFPPSFKIFILRLFPFIEIIAKYKWKEDTIRDLIAGATVAFLHVPQAMAYGQLATLRPIHGLYVAFFPGLIYFFMGTSRHISIGVFALVSLMMAKVLDTEIETGGYGLPAPPLADNVTDANSSSIYDYEEEELKVRVEIAISYNLIIGIMQLTLGIIGAGFVTEYLSEPFISGYTTACACHVVTSQFWLGLGVKSIRHSGAFKIIYSWRDLFLAVPRIHWITFGIFCATLVLLTIWKEVLEPRVKRKISIPIPVELLLIIVADIISIFVELHPVYKVPIVGPIPSEFPIPRAPKYFRANYIVDAIPVVLVSFTICISLGKVLAKKYKYSIRPNQEFVAVGTANLVSSFFSCYPASTAMSRTMVQSNVGGRTQVASVISSAIILVVILVVGRFLQPLPTSILGAVVIVNLKGMFVQFWDLPKFWHVCKLDGVIWLVTFATTLLTDVDVGLYVGVGSVIATVIIRTAQTRVSIQQRVGNTELFAPKSKKLNSTHPVVVIEWCAPLYFGTLDKMACAIRHGLQPNEPCDENDLRNKVDEESPSAEPPTAVILDLGGVTFIDTAGVDFIEKTAIELAATDVDLLFVNIPRSILNTLAKVPAMKEILLTNTFVRTIDALTVLQSSPQRCKFWRKAAPVKAKPAETDKLEPATTEILLKEEGSKV